MAFGQVVHRSVACTRHPTVGYQKRPHASIQKLSNRLSKHRTRERDGRDPRNYLSFATGDPLGRGFETGAQPSDLPSVSGNGAARTDRGADGLCDSAEPARNGQDSDLDNGINKTADDGIKKTPDCSVTGRADDGREPGIGTGIDKTNSEPVTEASSAPLREVAPALVKATWRLLRQQLWLMIVIFAMCDATTFLLHRASHRITNEVALRILPGITAGDIGNIWYLSNNGLIANFQTGYQYLVIVFFIVVFPLNVLLRSCATTAAALSCVQTPGPQGSTQAGWRPPLRALWREVAALAPRVRTLLSNVWLVDVQVALRALPLQALSLAVIPLPWTLPRLVHLQLANPVAVLEETPGELALSRSERLVKPIQWAFAVPYLTLMVVPRILSLVKEALLRLVPPRILRDVPELPLAAYLALVALSVIVGRLQDLLPIATYLYRKPEAAASAANSPAAAPVANSDQRPST